LFDRLAAVAGHQEGPHLCGSLPGRPAGNRTRLRNCLELRKRRRCRRESSRKHAKGLTVSRSLL